jgi:hypothetical protein
MLILFLASILITRALAVPINKPDEYRSKISCYGKPRFSSSTEINKDCQIIKRFDSEIGNYKNLPLSKPPKSVLQTRCATSQGKNDNWCKQSEPQLEGDVLLPF